ncbi:piggyBac transposable element-derived protein 4-like [Bradysia coprophila]|uniref:piggyBac transposable element-derived protein 4-like n=1 Tax=Bradysia coprophila TaxID=38358 RepID=UPI00187D9984|nr:piggyBac transposable element-derived protein 4-like [Bradysia coprophila]
MIVEESNRYHETIPIRCKDSNKRKHQKAWEPIDRKEMYVFLATFMLMSAVKKSKMQEYWSTDPLIETPIFKKIMPRDRFLEILRALHFNDNEKQVPGDRLFKIRPVMELLKDRFPFFINAYKNLAIDESLMLWKGRLCFKQFISSKRHRFGVKLFILCDCSTGAILDFIVYTGSNTEIISYEELGISGSVVMTLLQPYLGKGHSVFLDNWYSSPKLFVECVRKSVKWYKKFFFHLVDMTVFNCNVMATIQSGQKCGLGKFRNELVRKLLSKYGQIQTPKQRIVSAASTPYPKRLIDRHFPSKISSDGSSRLRTRTCFVCSHSKRRENKRSSSRFECVDCNVGLCVSECFREYHTLLHF